MRLSTLFTRTSKTVSSDADSKNASLLTRGGFIHKTLAGSYSFLPLGLRVIRTIERIVREEINAAGGQEILMSALSSKEAWEKTGRWDTLDVLFRYEDTYAFCPTHEEVVTPIAKSFVKSYRDLPFCAYQIQTKFRNEPRAKSGVLRGREFIMKDAYSFHATPEDLDAYYDRMAEAYTRIFTRLGFESVTYFTYASGGSFSKYSHEFQVVIESGEDTIYISEEAEKAGLRVAVNKEIFEEGMPCPATGKQTTYREVRASEVGNIFKLQTKFSDAFDLTFLDSTGAQKTALMGCYGIGISRLLGVLAEYYGTEKGILFPEGIAPYHVHLIPFGKNPKILEIAEELYQTLGADRAIIDTRDCGFGEKMADADLIGSPHRLIISDKSLEKDSIEYKKVIQNESILVNLENLPQLLSNLAE